MEMEENDEISQERRVYYNKNRLVSIKIMRFAKKDAIILISFNHKIHQLRQILSILSISIWQVLTK